MLDLRMAPVVFVTGKGGVGKTTVAAALALDAARRGGRAALVQLGGDDTGARALGRSRSAVEHLSIQPDQATGEAAATLLGSRTLARLLTGHPVMRKLIAAAPGISELVSLEAVRALATSGRYQRIVVDLPASGHAVGWLRVGAAIERFASVGPFCDMARKVDALVKDGSRSTLIVVALAEPLVIKETAELCATLRSEIGRTPAMIVVNRFPPEDPLAAIEVLGRSPGPDARALLDLLEARRAAHDEASRALADLGRSEPSPRVCLPESSADPEPDEVLSWLETPMSRDSDPDSTPIRPLESRSEACRS